MWHTALCGARDQLNKREHLAEFSTTQHDTEVTLFHSFYKLVPRPPSPHKQTTNATDCHAKFINSKESTLSCEVSWIPLSEV